MSRASAKAFITDPAGSTSAADVRASIDVIYDDKPIVVRKTADETVTNSTVLQDDDHLFFAIGANEVWVAELNAWAVLSSGSTAGPKALFTGPAGSTVIYGTDSQLFNAGGGSTVGAAHSDQTTPVSFYADTSMRPVRLHVYAANGATGGFVRLRWAQQTATAVDTTLKVGSYLYALKIA